MFAKIYDNIKKLGFGIWKSKIQHTISHSYQILQAIRHYRDRFSEFKAIGNPETNWVVTLTLYDPYNYCS